MQTVVTDVFGKCRKGKFLCSLLLQSAGRKCLERSTYKRDILFKLSENKSHEHGVTGFLCFITYKGEPRKKACYKHPLYIGNKT